MIDKYDVIVSETSFPIRHLAVCSCGKRTIVMQTSFDVPMTAPDGWIALISPNIGFACGEEGHYPMTFEEVEND